MSSDNLKKVGIKKHQRIKKNEKFSDLFSNGKKESSRYILLFYKTAQASAVGFAVSKKNGCAVKRNRARRILRELYRLNRKELRATVEMAMLAREGILRAPNDKLVLELVELFHRIRS